MRPPGTPPAARAPGEAARDPEAERRAAIRARLEASLGERLSPSQLDAATDALLRLRAARLALNRLPRTPENSERLRELTDEVGRAALDFEALAGEGPAAFEARAPERAE